MIIHHFILLVSLALSISSTEALLDLNFSTNNINFFRDVIKPLEIKQQEENEDGLKDMLMKKAIPLEDYNREIVAKGGIPITVDPDDEFEIITSNQDEEMETDYDRHLSGESRRLENNAEYNYNINNEKDFSSYSFKYAKCQPVKRFSDMAAYNGEYSPLVTDYLVVFRFCPRNRCKASSKWGCSSGYGQYVIDLPSYLRAQMYYQYNKRPYLCPFCKECAFTDDYFGSQRRGRKLDEADDDDSSSSSTTSSSATSGTYATATDDDTSSSQTYSETCTKYDFLCEGYGSWCAAYDDDDDSGKNADAPDLLDLIDYFDCVNVEGNDGRNAGYWIGPRCDSYTNKISMGIFYDPYCSQYAGNEVSINDQGGVNFDQSMFVQTYKPHCFPCDVNVSSLLLLITMNTISVNHLPSLIQKNMFTPFSQEIHFMGQRITSAIKFTMILVNVMNTWHTV